MDVREFDFDLPPELIAQEPPRDRGGSRLLHIDRATGAIHHTHVTALGDLLRAGDLVVVNDTRVFPARLLGRRVPSGGAVECLLVARVGSRPGSDTCQTGVGPGSDPSLTPVRPPQGARHVPGTCLAPDGEVWEALMHPGQKLKPGARVVFEGIHTVHGEILEQRFFGRRILHLWTEDGSTIDEAVDAIGHMPLPPYIKRDDAAADRDRYQTVFARARGSIAAPTAGLHFTPAILDSLRARGVAMTAITLHVGYGTFQPVRVERVEEHRVDAEHYEISAAAADAISRARAAGRRIVAVGTTTTRTLEHIARLGEGVVTPGRGVTDLFIYPGFEFRIVNSLLTNFHLPRSSLLMLVAAFGGLDLVRSAYDAAVAAGYRFYSYGDAMLIT
jgi:S-adenosylmethionine:tRNA ribosyltransferase-isomerase